MKHLIYRAGLLLIALSFFGVNTAVATPSAKINCVKKHVTHEHGKTYCEYRSMSGLTIDSKCTRKGFLGIICVAITWDHTECRELKKLCDEKNSWAHGTTQGVATNNLLYLKWGNCGNVPGKSC